MKTTSFPSSNRHWPQILLSLALLLVTGIGVLRMGVPGLEANNTVPLETTKFLPQEDVSAAEAKQLSYRVVESYPHDKTAFTQGLLWHNGGFYESTGLNGQSSLRRVEFPSGRVLRKQNLPRQFFGEGLAMFDDRLIQLTWQSGVAFVYDRETFKLLGQWRYEGEGWGLTNDDKHLIMSDGSDTLTFRDPKNFAPLRQLRATMDGRPLERLNELEYIEGQIWANIWQTDLIVQIDPQSGVVVSYLDLTGLLPNDLRAGTDVLNGIAYDAEKKRIFVTGKNWPRLFGIEVDKVRH